MVINNTYFKDKKDNDNAIRFEELVHKAFYVLQDLIGIDDSEEICFYATELKESFGGTFSLLPLKQKIDEDDMESIEHIFGDSRKQALYCAYLIGCETFIEINSNHIENDDEDAVVDTIIHEILHHLTSDEEEEHGEKWFDLAKYVSKNSKYNIIQK